MPAQYFCSGEQAQEEWHHYGLAAPIYTHFTSPIRRYADVCVHRLLGAAIGVSPLPTFLMDKVRAIPPPRGAKQHETISCLKRTIELGSVYFICFI